MRTNQLLLNDDKTELLLVGTKQQLAKMCVLRTSNLVVLKYLLLPVLETLACGLIPA